MSDMITQSLGLYANTLKTRSLKQEMIAGNIANADTPGFKAKDLDFASTLESLSKKGKPVSSGLTHSAHIPLKQKSLANLDGKFRTTDKAALDNNTVNMDHEKAAFAENTVKFEAASKALASQIKTMQTAIAPQ